MVTLRTTSCADEDEGVDHLPRRACDFSTGGAGSPATVCRTGADQAPPSINSPSPHKTDPIHVAVPDVSGGAYAMWGAGGVAVPAGEALAGCRMATAEAAAWVRSTHIRGHRGISSADRSRGLLASATYRAAPQTAPYVGLDDAVSLGVGGLRILSAASRCIWGGSAMSSTSKLIFMYSRILKS
jgi:hypothetical protein